MDYKDLEWNKKEISEYLESKETIEDEIVFTPSGKGLIIKTFIQSRENTLEKNLRDMPSTMMFRLIPIM